MSTTEEVIANLNFLYLAYRTDKRFAKIRVKSLLIPGTGPLDPFDSPKLIIVGEAPGRTEVKRGKPFVGRSGALLDEFLDEFDMPREECYITNLVKYWPGPGNPDPSPEEMQAGVEYLRKEVSIVAGDCRIIVSLGRLAGAYIYGESNFSLGKMHGIMADLHNDFKLFPMYHPAWGLRAPANADVMRKDFARLRELMQND